MIKISVDATVLHLMVDDKATLALKLSDGTYVDFPIYDESFPLVKAGKKFRLTLEEMEMEEVGSLLEINPATESANEAYQAMNDVLAQNSKMGKTPYRIIDELRGDVAALGTIKKALNQLEVRNEERLASYPDPEIEAYRKHLQEVIMPEANVGEKPSSLIETAKEFVKEMVPTASPLSDPQYNARKRKCGKCANSSNPSACIRCSDYSKFEPSRYK